MKTNARVAIAVTAVAGTMALGPVPAAEVDPVTELAKPESSVGAGVGYVSDDNTRFGQYNGLRDKGGYGLLDLDLVKRDDATGTWMVIRGHSLGLDHRDLRLEHNRQGDWGYFLEFNQIPRFEPYTANTAVTGIGTPNLSVPAAPTAGTPVELKTERQILGAGFDKILSGGFDVQVRVRSEDKTGERVFARGTTGGAGLFQFTPEPIDSNTQQIEAILGYVTEKLQLSGGYYGTFYNNRNTALNITEVGAATGLAGFTPIALPPDNEAHQLYLTGGYSFTSTARSTFKLAYAKATQNDTFIPTPAANPNLTGKSQLDGRLDITQMQVGVTSQPLPKLLLLANLRYEDRDDKTPIVTYVTSTSGTNTFDGLYEPRSIKTTAGKVEAGYPLPFGVRVTGGVEHEIKKRFVPSWFGGALAAVTTREETDETTYRVQFRRSLSETVNGALSFARSDRGGSELLTNRTLNGNAGSNLIAPLHLADRDRDKWRLSTDWAATEALSLQFVLEDAKDEYSGRALGPRTGRAQNYAIDASYTFSDDWQGNAWVSRNNNRIEQATCENASGVGVCPNTAADPIWQAKIRNEGDAIGLGVRGKATSKLDVGADLQYSRFEDRFSQEAITPGAVITPLPDINTRLASLRLYTRYALQKNTGVRVDYIYDRFRTDDWSWTTWTYTDGTQLVQEPDQNAHFVGVSVYYRWW